MLSRKRVIRFAVILVALVVVGLTLHLVGSTLIPVIAQMHGGG